MSILEAIKNITNINQIQDLDFDEHEDFACNIYAKDCKGKYLGCNDSEAKAAGFNKANDLVGYTDFDFCWSNDAAIFRKNDKKVMGTEKAITFVETITGSDGNKFRAISHKAPLRTCSKKVIGTIGLSFILNNVNNLPLFNEIEASESYGITKRQAECLYYLVRGMTMKQIAATLQLSPKTVEHYLETIKLKLNCYSRSELITKALEMGFGKLSPLL